MIWILLAIIVAVIGISVVFLFLAILSALMVAIRGADHLLPGAMRRGGASASPLTAGGEDSVAPQHALYDWVIAAAVAYLELEDRDALPDAAPWTASRPPQNDPWHWKRRG